jgi:hypothetical protein
MPKFQIYDEVMVHTKETTLVGIVIDREINEDHEKYYVGTGNTNTTKWYDVTQIQKLEPTIRVVQTERMRMENARVKAVYP